MLQAGWLRQQQAALPPASLVTARNVLKHTIILCALAAGDRRLLIKYRPAKKAAIHLRALGLVDEDGSPTDDRFARLAIGVCDHRAAVASWR